MAENEVNYASVVFKSNKKNPPEAKKEEETVYDEVKGQSKTTEQTADTNASAGFSPDKKDERNRRPHNQQLVCCLEILCVILLLGIIAMAVYITLRDESDASELKQLKDNQTTLLAVNHNLTQAYTVLASNNTNLTSENQQLKTQRDNLKQQLQNMETKWNSINVSEAQWIIDAYCPKGSNGKQCKACQDGWLHFQSSCVAINNAESSGQKTWEEAREDCRGKRSDLAVIVNEGEKTFPTNISWAFKDNNKYWIGLKGENGSWKWVDGSFLNQNSWKQSPTKGSCVITTQNEGWKSVSCGDKNGWICKKKAVSV